MKTLKNFIGIDADLETSLFECGFICEQYLKDGQKDEFFCIYKQNERFGTGYVREKFLDDLVKGKEWMDKKDIESFLSSVGSTIAEWLKLPFVFKLSDLLGHYGTENIFGTDYYPMTEDELREVYEF